jgi:glycosyltransferase involved in cell wall biosynthesis
MTSMPISGRWTHSRIPVQSSVQWQELRDDFRLEMNELDRKYGEKDIAFIIPTKDRPVKLATLLDSFVRQTVQCGRIIIVDGGVSVRDVVNRFSSTLPLEYYACYPPGQIRQRNMAISLLNEGTPIVGFLDDDIVLEPGAIEAITNFWNRSEGSTAGISFNIVNNPPVRTSWLKCILGLSSRAQGRVLRSGMTTPNSPVQSDLRSQWLCGGATTWKQGILKEHLHGEISSKWAIGEDLLFSYPIGKLYPLYVCADARVRHEHQMDYVSKMKHRFHGRTQTLWLFYFIKSNRDLSFVLFLWTLSLRILGRVAMGIVTFNKDHLEFSLGQIEAAAKGCKALVSGRGIQSILSEE